MEVMKQLRQRAIRDLVEQRPIRTQQELATWAALGVKAVVVWGWALPGAGDDVFVPEEPEATHLAQVFDSFAV